MGLLLMGLAAGEARAEPRGARSPEQARARTMDPSRPDVRGGTESNSKGGAAADAVPAHAGEASAPEPSWCAPDVEELAEGYCYSPLPSDVRASSQPGSERERRTLVIFLHSLVTARTDWQWQQQRMMARSGKKNGFAVLFPRGRLGIGPGRDRNTWAWPGSAETQRLYEDEVIAGWLAAKARVEEREGRFDEVFVFGFSNGAYYATTLAMRGRFPADGYGVFAGGSGSTYHRILAQNLETRTPVFVGYGTKDPDHRRQLALIDLLRDFHWPHDYRSARVGHMVTDSQLDEAVEFLRAKRETGSN